MSSQWITQVLPLLKAMEFALFLVLAALFVAVPAVYAWRLVALRTISGKAAHWGVALTGDLGSGGAASSFEAADGGRSLPDRLAAFALSHTNLCPDALERLLEAREIEDKRDLERGLGFLGTVGANAPFVGLTGTVLGILSAFQAMAAAGTQGGTGVMSSIAGALVATAAGLFVAIPAVVFHNLLQARVDWILDESRQLRGILVARSVQAVATGVEEPG
ncbi:MAG TPA: MotA/TolQ/ExbB proton channel family protein [Fibrobacteria bacterium]|nr:MotA/TolQ/ExbB proton channel family protein [Fibrobacteria bacterium]HOX51770.1 MotA/TolQ/ExbB proton channel family protein [Fibrobacteria bacterium]